MLSDDARMHSPVATRRMATTPAGPLRRSATCTIRRISTRQPRYLTEVGPLTAMPPRQSVLDDGQSNGQGDDHVEDTGENTHKWRKQDSNDGNNKQELVCIKSGSAQLDAWLDAQQK